MGNGNENFQFRFHSGGKFFDLFRAGKSEFFKICKEKCFVKIRVKIFQDRHKILWCDITAESGIGQYNAEFLSVCDRQFVHVFSEQRDLAAVSGDQPENRLKCGAFSGAVLPD